MFRKLVVLLICVLMTSAATLSFAEEVYTTANGKKYHSADCRLIANKDAKAISLEEAQAKSLTACSKCIGKAKEISSTNIPDVEGAVFVTKSGNKFHKESCNLIKNRETQSISKKEAIAKEMSPCAKCFKEETAKAK